MSLEAVFARWAREDWKARLQAQDVEREQWISARLAPYPDEERRAWMRNQLEKWLAGSEKPGDSNQGSSPRSESGGRERFSLPPK
jgi:hypothetical protein